MESVALKMRTVTGIGVGERATIGKLREAGAGELASGSEIAVCRTPIDEGRVTELFRADFSALVCVGDGDSKLADAARRLGFTALFVSDEDIDDCVCGENAVLYPQKGVLFVSPTVDIIDGFVADKENDTRAEVGVSISRVYDNDSCAFIGRAVENIDTSRGEDELFEIYCGLSEECGEGELTVCINKNGGLSEQARAILRAAVYGRVSAAVSAKTPSEYKSFRELFDAAGGELAGEEREFEESVRVGVVAEDIFGFIYASELSEKADFFAVNLKKIAEAVSADSQNEVCERYISLIRERLSPRASDFRVIDTSEEKSKGKTEKIK